MRGAATNTERQGRLVDWNDARGFGFIEESGRQGRIFVHIKDFTSRSIRPTVGDEVAYLLGTGRDGRPAATQACIIGVDPRPLQRNDDDQAPLRLTVRVVGALVIATMVLFCVAAGRAPIWLLLAYFAGSVVSFSAYLLDKRAAVRGTWRTMEETLHFFDLAFGIPGGLLAQGVFRHKSSKRVFGIVTALIFGVHIAVLGMLLAGYGPAQWLAWLTA